jgi:hypothetical protein
MDPHVKRTVLTKFGGWLENRILDFEDLDSEVISNGDFAVDNNPRSFVITIGSFYQGL